MSTVPTNTDAYDSPVYLYDYRDGLPYAPAPECSPPDVRSTRRFARTMPTLRSLLAFRGVPLIRLDVNLSVDVTIRRG